MHVVHINTGFTYIPAAIMYRGNWFCYKTATTMAVYVRRPMHAAFNSISYLLLSIQYNIKTLESCSKCG